jgi:aminotransferase
VVAITDEIYEHLVYDGEHVAMAQLPGMRERTVTISGLSKTYSVTGWRVGYVIAPADLTDAIRKVHDFLTVGAPAPLQAAGVTALNFPDSYYAELVARYRERRDLCLSILEAKGFACHRPAGAYYIMADIRPLGCDDDIAFAHYLVREVGVAVVPGSSFYREQSTGRTKIRFVFAKRLETLTRAGELLRNLKRQ